MRFKDVVVLFSTAVGLIAMSLRLQAAPATVAGPEDSSDTAGLAEIVVVAEKRSENLQSIPIAISAISGSQLQSAGITDTLDLAPAFPGLNMSYGNDAIQPHLRGVGSSAAGAGVENPVAIYVDGVYYGNQFGVPHDLFNISQISVLYGPQGTLFGRNATGGVIQMTSRDPSQTSEGIFQTGLDNYLTTNNNLYVSGGVRENLAANFSFHYLTQFDGWGTNHATDEDIHRVARDISATSKWIYSPNDNTSLKVAFDYANAVDSNGFNAVPYPGTKLLVPGYVGSSNPWDVDQGIDNRDRYQLGGSSLTWNQHLGFADLVSISAYRQVYWRGLFDLTATPLPGESISARVLTKQTTEEVQLVSPSDSKVRWVTGVFLFHSEDGTGAGQDVYLRGFFAPLPTSFGQIANITSIKTNSAAAFGQATTEVVRDTNLTVGFRYTYEHKDFSRQSLGFLVNGTPIGELPLASIPLDISFNKPTWRLALDHQITPDMLAYVSYNRGFKSGGYNGFSPGQAPYLPEQIDAEEVGLKTEWLEHRLKVNSAAFYYSYSDIQVTSFQGGTEHVNNAAKARMYGLDMDAEARVTRDFHLTAALELLHAEFTAYPGAQFSMPLPNGGAVLVPGDASGNQVPFSPKSTFSLGADYTVAFHGLLDFNLTNYVSGRYFFEQDNRLYQPGYDKVNSSVTWTSTNDAVSVRLYGNNLTDRAVSPQAITTGVGYLESFSYPPRTLGFVVTYKMGRP
jgi:iron complex outermembrane receptor protein